MFREDSTDWLEYTTPKIIIPPHLYRWKFYFRRFQSVFSTVVVDVVWCCCVGVKLKIKISTRKNLHVHIKTSFCDTVMFLCNQLWLLKKYAKKAQLFALKLYTAQTPVLRE